MVHGRFVLPIYNKAVETFLAVYNRNGITTGSNDLHELFTSSMQTMSVKPKNH